MSVTGIWKLDAGLQCNIVYKKRFAIFPKTCADGIRVWMKFYYKKYEVWSNTDILGNNEYGHSAFVESITSQEYIVRKLAETL